jgi:hypothetical protein
MAQSGGDTESAITWWDIALAVLDVRSGRDPGIGRVA